MYESANGIGARECFSVIPSLSVVTTMRTVASAPSIAARKLIGPRSFHIGALRTLPADSLTPALPSPTYREFSGTPIPGSAESHAKGHNLGVWREQWALLLYYLAHVSKHKHRPSISHTYRRSRMLYCGALHVVGTISRSG
jgi:hypothetical protein